MSVIQIINGTVVPIHFPPSFTPAEIDKLGTTASVTLTWAALAGALVLIVGTRDWRKVCKNLALTLGESFEPESKPS